MRLSNLLRLSLALLLVLATTLARAYSTGSGGPPCRHIRNKPYYPLDLLTAWAEAQITAPVASSSERQRLKRESRPQEASHVR